MTIDEAILLAVGARFSEVIDDETLSNKEVVALKNAAFLESLAASGFAVVPIEATDEMLEALVDKGLDVDGYTRSLEIGDLQAGYRAMLDAAQKEQG